MVDGINSVQAKDGLFVVDGKAMDLGALVLTLNLERTQLMDQGIADQMSAVKDRNDKLRQLNDTLAQLRQLKASGGAVVQQPGGSFSVDANTGTIDLGNGYQIVVNPKQSGSKSDADWKIVGPDGKESTIWGDPHVAEGDGGSFQFYGDSTFVLPDGTKISVGTEQYQNTEHRVSSTLTITRGDQAVTVTGVNSESPTISNVMSNGHELDAQTNDGYIFTTVKGSADDWALDNKEVDAGSTSTEEQVALDANYRNELQVIDKEELSKLGIDVVDADSDGTLSVDDLSAMIENTKAAVDSLNSDSQLDMTRLQSIVNKRNQAFDTASNMLQNDQKSRDSVARNLGG